MSSKKFDFHDFRDSKFYQLAVPYSDIVVGETAAMSALKQGKLDQKYNTKFIKFKELESALLTINAA